MAYIYDMKYKRLLNITKTQSFFIFGARSTGKSTWLQEAFDEEQHLWVDLTNPEIERRYARRPGILLEEWKVKAARCPKDQPKPWIVVDEVQKIPGILDVAHTGIQRHGIRFALTGSSARKLRRGSANLLAGRAHTFRMHPLTYRELGPDFDLVQCLRWGGLPALYGDITDGDRRRTLDAYVTTYLREEIQMEQLVRSIEPFRMFLDVVGQVSGETINAAKIAREASISPKSAERYFEILVDTLIGIQLPGYHRSIRKRQIQHPKFYLFDVGVWRALQRELSVPLESHTTAFGKAFEHFLIQQFIALNDYRETGYRFSYLRTKDDVEVDLVIERPGQPAIFAEIKSAERIDAVDLRGLRSLARDLDGETWILCREGRERMLDGLRVVPWWQALDELFPTM
jgi:predicted AAA+ superfamily ATPase